MNRSMKLLALALALVCAPAAHAQDSAAPPSTTNDATSTPRTIWIGPHAGIDLPIGDFADVANTGFHLGIGGDYVMNSMWAFGGELSWHVFGGNDDLEKELSADLGEAVDLTVRVLPIIGHVKYLLPASGEMMPFVRGGIGIFSIRSEVEAGAEQSEESDTNLGFLIGGGINFKGSSRVAYGAEAFYQYIATEDDATNMLVLRGNFLFGLSR